MAGLDFCCECGDWIGANSGTIRQGPDGVEIICSECSAIEQKHAIPLSHKQRVLDAVVGYSKQHRGRSKCQGKVRMATGHSKRPEPSLALFEKR